MAPLSLTLYMICYNLQQAVNRVVGFGYYSALFWSSTPADTRPIATCQTFSTFVFKFLADHGRPSASYRTEAGTRLPNIAVSGAEDLLHFDWRAPGLGSALLF
jgi:hypothetical protein